MGGRVGKTSFLPDVTWSSVLPWSQQVAKKYESWGSLSPPKSFLCHPSRRAEESLQSGSPATTYMVSLSSAEARGQLRARSAFPGGEPNPAIHGFMLHPFPAGGRSVLTSNSPSASLFQKLLA